MEPFFEDSENFLAEKPVSSEYFQFSCKVKLCVFCARLIDPYIDNWADAAASGISKDTFLQGVSVLCELLRVEEGNFASADLWQLMGVDNFVEWVCCTQCYKLVEQVVSLHQLLLTTQANLNDTVNTLQGFLVESEKREEPEYSINICVQFREAVLQNIARKTVPETKPLANKNLSKRCTSRRRPGPRSKTGVSNPVVRLERIQLPVKIQDEFQDEGLEGVLLPAAEDSIEFCHDDSNAYPEPSSPFEPASPEPRPRKRKPKEDEDYKPVPKRRRGTGRKRGRPRIHPKVKRVPGKRGRPPKPRTDEEEDEDGGKRRRRMRRKVVQVETKAEPNVEDLNDDEESVHPSDKEEENDDGDEEYLPEKDEDVDDEYIPDKEENVVEEANPLPPIVPKRSRGSSRRSDPNIVKRPRGRPAAVGSRRYRILNNEGPLYSHKPIYVLDRAEGLLMFYNVKFRRGVYSLECLHPDCQHVEPLNGYFSDQVAFRNFQFHVRHHHRNAYKPVGDTSKNLYYCHLCHAQLESRDLLSEHRRTNHPDYTMPPVLCEVCGDVMSQYSIIRHTIVHKNEEEKKVALAAKKSRLGKIRDITKPLQFPCDECSKTFKCHTELRIHKESHIPLEVRRQHICEICGVKFARENTVEYHKRKVHFKDMPWGFECRICSRKYKAYEKEKYEIHVRAHTGETPFQCPQCGKGFRGKDSLKKHERLHDETRGSVTCEFCPKVYKNYLYLKRHHRKHHPDLMKNKPDLEKSLKYKMSQPLYNMIGPKLCFPCEPCGHQYQYKSMLITHLKGKHNMQLANKEDYPVMWTMEDHYSQTGAKTETGSYYQ